MGQGLLAAILALLLLLLLVLVLLVLRAPTASAQPLPTCVRIRSRH
ncbi:MAG: hypothetical protein ACK531_01320 [Cyanobacteriota bacterium]